MEELILAERELKAKLVNVVNESNMPAFIIRPIIKELLDEVTNVANKQYEEAIEKVKEKQNKEEEEKEDGIR